MPNHASSFLLVCRIVSYQEPGTPTPPTPSSFDGPADLGKHMFRAGRPVGSLSEPPGRCLMRVLRLFLERTPTFAGGKARTQSPGTELEQSN